MDSNQRFLLKTFRKYYRANTPFLPDRFTRREFGFMFFDKTFVQRHIGFHSSDELHRFMESQVPSHSYYSTAYYRTPDAPTMEEKGWMGAELIFDLDADHLEGADRMSFDDMLAQIKKEMISLVDNYLFGDMGFSPEDVYITFSGGRGYHAHVKMPEVLGLGSHERREIVDFVTSRGLNIDWVFAEEARALGTANVGGRTVANIKRFRTIPPADSGGWRLRMRNALKDVVNDICDMDVPEIKKAYPSTKKNQSLAKIQEDLRKSRNVIFENNKMATLAHNTQELLVKIMAEDVAIRISGEVDEPVTADIKRLIRLPGSIHGKSGLRVTPLSREELTDFDPMTVAIPKEYSDDPVKITMKRDYDFNMKGQHFKLSSITEVPEYAAVFLIGKKLADIGDGSKPKDPFF
jgi:DNA primase small subunit